MIINPPPTGPVHLRAFLMVADRLSFSHVADALGIKQSAFRHAVRALEEQLGAQLSDCTARGVVLTPAGEALSARLGQATDAIGGALSHVRRVADRTSGTIRLVATRTAARLEVAPALARLSLLSITCLLQLQRMRALLNDLSLA